MAPWKAVLQLIWKPQDSTVSGKELLLEGLNPGVYLSVPSLLFRLEAVGGSLRILLTHLLLLVWFLEAETNVRTLQRDTINPVHFLVTTF